jgi:hypothetical protein
MALDRLSQITNSGISTTISFRAAGINVSGIVTASSFVGDGSGLTGVVGSGSGITIKDDNSTVGTAGTINFGSNLSVSAISSGIVTVTGTDTNTTYTQAAVESGANVNIRLTDSDATTDDILLTAGSNVTFSSVTAAGFTINSSGSGGSSQFAETSIGIHTLSNVGIGTTNPTSKLSVTGDANISGVVTAASFSGDGSTLTGITASQTPSFTTLNVVGVSTFAGITTVTGTTLFAKQLNVSGVVTATTFSGDGSALTGITASQTPSFTTLNVVGVSTFAGITTVTGTTLFAKQLNVSGVVTATTFVGSLTGNASSATYASNAGVATYASTSGISTVSQGLTGTPNIIVNNISSSGIVTIGTLSVDGESTLGTVKIASGIVTATSGITTFYGDTSNTVSGRWTLGASGTSDYTFIGIGFTQTTNDPTLYLKRGEVYEFVNNSGGSHPFQIRVSNGGAAYNNGVTNNGSATGTIRFEVPYNAPDTLYYQCTNHSAMGGDIIVIGGIRSIPQNSQTSAYILAIGDVGKHISITTGGVTVNASIFSAGDAVTIYNNSGSNQTITQGTSVTLRSAGTASTGNRTLAQYGVCTVLCVASNTFVISGAGLS